MSLKKIFYSIFTVIALFFFISNLTYNIGNYINPELFAKIWLKIISTIAIFLDPIIIWILFSKEGSSIRKNIDKILLTKASEEFIFESQFSLKPNKRIIFDSPKKDFNEFIKEFDRIRNRKDQPYRNIKKIAQKGSKLIINYDSVMKYQFDKFVLQVSILDFKNQNDEIEEEIFMFYINIEFREESRNLDLIQAQIRDIRTEFQDLLSEIFNIPVVSDIITFNIKRKKRSSLINLPDEIQIKKLILIDSKGKDFEIKVEDDKLVLTTKNLTKDAMKLMFEILILNY